MSRRSTAALYRRQPKNIRSGKPTPLDLFEVQDLGSSCLAGDFGRDDEKKAAREMQVFEAFVERSGLLIDPQSISKCHPPEPDMLCKVSGEYVAFELAECVPPTFLERFLTFLRRGVYRTPFGLVILCMKSQGRKLKTPWIIGLTIRSSFFSTQTVESCSRQK